MTLSRFLLKLRKWKGRFTLTTKGYLRGTGEFWCCPLAAIVSSVCDMNIPNHEIHRMGRLLGMNVFVSSQIVTSADLSFVVWESDAVFHHRLRNLMIRILDAA
jgi:hypothetical protein